MDCREIDGQVVRLEQIADVASEFVLVRLVRITGANLNVFEFDYDTTWAVFFMNADQKIYGRYGGRDARHPDDRLSLAGLNYAMRAALAAHRQGGGLKPAKADEAAFRVEDFPAAKRFRGGCIHCHQVNEFRRTALQSAGKWNRDDRWVYPLPENVGLTLEVDVGNRVRSVAAGSPAERVGVRAGDLVQSINGIAVASFADGSYALHHAPAKGKVPITWQRDGKTMNAELELGEGWKKTNLTWRPSLLDILPSLPLYGEDLAPERKKALGLSEKRLAFEQDKTVHVQAKRAGVQAGDIILGINGEEMEMTMLEFFSHVRRNYLVGDRITLNLLREGKRVDVPMTLG